MEGDASGFGPLRTDLGWVLESREGVLMVGMWPLIGSLTVTVFAVFLKLLPLGDMDGYQCGWRILVVRGSLKVTIFDFKVFLKPLVMGKVIASMCSSATKLGTLNYSIPNHSNVAYDRRMCMLVASSET